MGTKRQGARGGARIHPFTPRLGGCEIAVAVWAIAALACGGPAPPAEAFDPAMPPTEVPLLAATSNSARWTVSVWTRPDPPRKGTAHVLYRVVDNAGAVGDGLRMAVLPWMPAHGHGAASPAPVTPQGDGWYLVSPVLFYMSGRWELRTTIQGASPGSGSDAVVPVLDVR